MEAAFAPDPSGVPLAYSNLNVILSSVGQGFSTLAPGGGGNVKVAGTLLAGAITGASTVAISAAGTLNLTNNSGTSSTTNLAIPGAATLNVTAGQTFTVTDLNLATSATLTKTGGGAMTITGLPSAATTNASVIFNGIYAPASPSILDLQGGGALVFNSSASGPALTFNSSELVLDDSISTNLGSRLGGSTRPSLPRSR